MPHYKDGSLAKIGDRVIGSSYNRGGIPEEGILVQITSSGDACNCKVWFPARAPKAADGTYDNSIPWVPENGYAPEGTDYGEVRAFQKLPEEALA